jgi:hypothetical protein
MAVDGRIEPVRTTGLSLLVTRWRKYDVSSRCRAVRDGDAIDVGRREQLVHALGELQPDLVFHVLAADAGDLLARDVGDVLQLRDGGDQGVDAHRARLVAGIVGFREAPAIVRRGRILISAFFCAKGARGAQHSPASSSTIRRVSWSSRPSSLVTSSWYCAGSRLVSFIGSSSSLICGSVSAFFSG